MTTVLRSGAALIALAGMVAAPGPAAPAGDPNAAKGLVADHCVKCHEVPRYSHPGGRATIDAPAFQDLADDEDTYSDERLRDYLGKPHYPMGGYTFSPSDIDNLVAFIRSLKRR